MPALRFVSMYIAVSPVCVALLLLNAFPVLGRDDARCV
jgi:hypothetical protein